MLRTPASPCGPVSFRLRATLPIAAAIIALAALGGCAAESAPRVTLTVPAAADPGDTDPGTTDPGTTDPGTTDPGSSDPGDGPSIVVSQGAVADACTNSVCHYLHVKWQNLEPGPHYTQCVTTAADLGAWSDSTYNYATADGEQDLGCFLGYPGSQVWVIIDGELTSNAVAWG